MKNFRLLDGSLILGKIYKTSRNLAKVLITMINIQKMSPSKIVAYVPEIEIWEE